MSKKALIIGAAALAGGLLLWVVSRKPQAQAAPAPGSKKPPCGQMGDVDGDGWVTQGDAEMIAEYIAHKITLTADQLARADVNGDGKVDIFDASMVSQYLNGQRDTFPVCTVGPPPPASTGTVNISSNPSGVPFALTGLAGGPPVTPRSLTNMPAGTYTITWGAVSGYAAPPSESKTLAAGGTISFQGNYTLISQPISKYALAITISPGGGGTVSPSSGQFTAGQALTLTATPTSGYTFDHWSGNVSGTSPTIAITMNANKSVVANFVPLQPIESAYDFVKGVIDTVIAEPYVSQNWAQIQLQVNQAIVFMPSLTITEIIALQQVISEYYAHTLFPGGGPTPTNLVLIAQLAASLRYWYYGGNPPPEPPPD